MKSYQKAKEQRLKDPLRYAMRSMVNDEFMATMRLGVIVVTREEMVNVFINLLAEFIEFQRQQNSSCVR